MAEVAVGHQMEEVELDESDQSIEYENLPIHQLNRETELTEINWTPTSSYKEENVHLKHETSEQNYRVEREENITVTTTVVPDENIPDQQHGVTTVVVPNPPPSTPLQYEPPPVQNPVTAPKKTKHVQISFPAFGRRNQHQAEVGQENVESRHNFDRDAAVSIKLYPGYLRRPIGILRCVQILLGIIVCSAINAEQCFDIPVYASGHSFLFCGPPSSKNWGSDDLGGIGYVLFVGIVFILANFALIFYHMLTKPRPATTAPTSERLSIQDRARIGEFVYDATAVVFYIIAASVAAWYASWFLWPRDLYNSYRPQWIAATVFAWINTILYGVTLVYSLFFA